MWIKRGKFKFIYPLVKLTKLGHGHPLLRLQLFNYSPPPVTFFWIHACPWRLESGDTVKGSTGLIHFGGTEKRGAPETHLVNNAFYLWENIGLTWAILDHCYCKLPFYFFGGFNIGMNSKLYFCDFHNPVR